MVKLRPGGNLPPTSLILESLFDAPSKAKAGLEARAAAAAAGTDGPWLSARLKAGTPAPERIGSRLP
jgi:hypothetical protein